MRMCKLNREFGIDAKNTIDYVNQKSMDGALAALESFYYSFNNRDPRTMMRVWWDHELMKLNNPLAGIAGGTNPISKVYDQIFNGEARVWVKFTDIIYYAAGDMAVFAGTEIGEFSIQKEIIPLNIRTSRVFGYMENESWFQLHHHGSIDDSNLLDRFQNVGDK